MFNKEVIEKIRELLIQHTATLAVAESVTSGLLQTAFASAEQAMEFFEGGITAYHINQKVRHLGIDRKTGEAYNCVSAQTAEEMATGVCRLFVADWGISVTGYATPVPESDHSLFAFFAICRRNKILLSNRISLDKEKPLEAQLKYVNKILEEFEKLLFSLRP